MESIWLQVEMETNGENVFHWSMYQQITVLLHKQTCMLTYAEWLYTAALLHTTRVVMVTLLLNYPQWCQSPWMLCIDQSIRTSLICLNLCSPSGYTHKVHSSINHILVKVKNKINVQNSRCKNYCRQSPLCAQKCDWVSFDGDEIKKLKTR